MVAVRYVLWLLFRLFLSLRYRIRVRGLDKVRGLEGPTLILPNHPGYIEPAIVLTTLWPALKPRPMMFEGTSGSILFKLLMKLINAIPIPELGRASRKAPSSVT